MSWNRKHLLDIESLTAAEIFTVLDTARAFKAVARFLKLPDEDIQGVSGHSVRVGATQDLLALNVDLASVMREGRWKTVRMPMRYGEHVMAARGGMARAAREQGREQ